MNPIEILFLEPILGTVWAYKIKVERDELASICARSERFIGTQGNRFNKTFLGQ